MPAQSDNAPGANTHAIAGPHYGHSWDYGIEPAPVIAASYHYQNLPQDTSAYTNRMKGVSCYPSSERPPPADQHGERSTPLVEVTHRNEYQGSSAQLTSVDRVHVSGAQTAAYSRNPPGGNRVETVLCVSPVKYCHPSRVGSLQVVGYLSCNDHIGLFHMLRANRLRSMPPRAEIRHFTTLPAADASHDQECPICQEAYDDQEHTAVCLKNIACDHVSGLPCLQEWVSSRMPNAHRCPSCRQGLKGALSIAAPDLRGRVHPAPEEAGPLSLDSRAQYENVLDTYRSHTDAAGRRRNMVEQFQAENDARQQWFRSVRADLESLHARGEGLDNPEDISIRQELRPLVTSLDETLQAVANRPSTEQHLANVQTQAQAPQAAATLPPPPVASTKGEGQSWRARRHARVVAADRVTMEILGRQEPSVMAVQNPFEEMLPETGQGGQYMRNEQQLMSQRHEDYMRQNRQLMRDNQEREQEDEHLRRYIGTS
jgi:hypothetical protein